MATDIRAAAGPDGISKTLDYKAVGKRLIQFIRAAEYELVETLIEKVAEIVLNEFSVPWVRVQLSMPVSLSGLQDFGVIIDRRQRHALLWIDLGILCVHSHL